MTTQNPQAVVEITESKCTVDTQKTNTVITWCSTHSKSILAELVSTTLLIFFGCMTCIPIDGLTDQPAMYSPFGFGLVVLFNIQIFGHISGAHMNPAVTLASVIWNNTSIALGLAYVIVQCLGAMIGYGLLVGLAPIDIATEGICVTMPHRGLNSYQTLGIEIMLTAVLVFICCALWDPVNQNKQESVPIKFGLAIAGLSLAGGPLTGASMNPARSLGPAVWTGVWDVHWTYWAGPFVGGAFAAIFYKIFWVCYSAFYHNRCECGGMKSCLHNKGSVSFNYYKERYEEK